MDTARVDRISTIIRVLMALNNVDQADLAEPAEISEATVSRRFAKGGWKAEELDRLAGFFGVPVATFFLQPKDVSRALGVDVDSVTLRYPSDERQPTLFDGIVSGTGVLVGFARPEPAPGADAEPEAA